MLKNVAKNRGKRYAQKAEENKNEDSGKATSEAGDKVVERKRLQRFMSSFSGGGGGVVEQLNRKQNGG